MGFKLTDIQCEFLNDTVPFVLYERFNTILNGEPKILKHIIETKEYTVAERIWLNALRHEYIKWKQDGSN